MASYGYTFSAGDTVTPTKLNNARTVSDIQTADISDAQITAAKLATNAVETAKINASAVTTAKLADANVTFAKLEAPQYTGFRNRIINGNFDIWQRGTSFTASAYGADRWFNGRVGSTCTMSRQAFTLGQTDVPNEPTYFCRMTVSSVSNAANYVKLEQLIEDVRTLAGQSLTVSFYAKADTNKTVALEFIQGFGTGGSPSSDVNAIGSQKINLTSSWQKFTATIAIPSISGKTLGSDNNSYLGFNLWLDAGSNLNSRTATLGHQSGTFDISQVQVERGTVATPFEARPIGTELALCQRYYVQESWIALNGSVVVGLPVSMRTIPTVSSTTGTAADAQNNRCFRIAHTTTAGTLITASAEL